MEGQIKLLYGLEAADGGALKHLAYLSTHLEPEIFEITVILSPRSDNIVDQIDLMRNSNIKIVIIPMARNISLVKDLLSLIKIVIFIFKHKFDIVHAHSSKAGLFFRIAAWINRVPTIIYTPHCFYFQSQSGVKKKLFQVFERILGCITHKLVVSNNEMEECLKGNIVSPDKLVNINNAIPFKEYTIYRRNTSLALLGIPENAVVIGAIGRLVQQKDLSTFIQAAALIIKQNPNAYFLIAGAGELYSALKASIKALNISERMILVGHQEEISKIYSAIDIFVSTSLWEGFPYVILEAMWYRKPIIATDLDYGKVLNNLENGYLIPPKDVNKLCEKLSILINDRKLCQDIGERNHTKVKANFPFKEFVRLHKMLYLQLSGAI